MTAQTQIPPIFDDAFRHKLETLFMWRRDVRRFSTDPVPQALIDHLLDVAQFSPSVGNSEPWRWVQVDSTARRAAIRADFLACNAEAAGRLGDQRAALYTTLKLEGMDQAPLQFAIFCDHDTVQGLGLGRQTMPEMLDYSTVSMITIFWLAARAAGLGVGWVSILHPDTLRDILDVTSSWRFIAYLCVGWPEEENVNPELQRLGWQARTQAGRRVVTS